MKHSMTITMSIPTAVLILLVAACSPQPALTATPGTLTDPFAYCAAVKTVDTPDARYVGTPVPDTIINGFKKAAGLESSSEPMDMLRQTTVWRCMDGKVYACNFGANLPCDAKANTDRTPSQAMQDYCTANPNSDFIPMSVTGHDSIYSWHCVQAKAEVLEQIGEVDAAGYLQEVWYEVPPSQ